MSVSLYWMAFYVPGSHSVLLHSVREKQLELLFEHWQNDGACDSTWASDLPHSHTTPQQKQNSLLVLIHSHSQSFSFPKLCKRFAFHREKVNIPHSEDAAAKIEVYIYILIYICIYEISSEGN